MLRVANYARRTGNLDVDVLRPSGRRAPDATHPDPEVASPEVMKVPHYLMIDSHGASLEDRYTATIPTSEANLELEPVLVLEPMEVHVVEEPPAPPPRRIRIHHFDLHPEHRLAHLDPDIDSCNQIIRSLAESYGETAPRSDVTEGVYLAGPITPPVLQPKRLLPESMTDRLPEEATPTAASPLASLHSPRDLQQTEVRDRLSGKPSPKASSLIDMYCEKERQSGMLREDRPSHPDYGSLALTRLLYISPLLELLFSALRYLSTTGSSAANTIEPVLLAFLCRQDASSNE